LFQNNVNYKKGYLIDIVGGRVSN